MQDFPAIPTLAPSNNVTVILGIDFNDTTQSAQFEIVRDNKKFNVSISAPVGELVQPNTITENDFLSLQGKSVRRQSRNVSVPQKRLPCREKRTNENYKIQCSAANRSECMRVPMV